MKGVFVSLLLAVPAAAFAQQPQPPAGDAVFTRACANCHQAGQTAVPPPEALRAYTPEAIVNALTNGKMAVQGATLTTAERVAVAQFLTGRTFAASTAPVEQVHRRDADDRSDAGAALDGLGQRHHQLPLRAAGRVDGPGPAASEVEVGVRLRRRDLGARAAGAGGRQAVRGERQRRTARARSEDRLHLLDVQGRVRRSQRAQRVAVPDAATPPATPSSSAISGQRLRGGHRDRAAGLEAQGGRAPGRRHHRRDRGGRRQGVRAVQGLGEEGTAARAERVLHVPRQPDRARREHRRACCGRPTPWTSRSCAARTRGTARRVRSRRRRHLVVAHRRRDAPFGLRRDRQRLRRSVAGR